MIIKLKVLNGRGCKCCDNLKPKLEKIASEKGYGLEFTDVGDVKDLPLDLTGVPYVILEQDGIFIDSWQGDMSEELIQTKIDSSLSQYNRILERKKSELK